MTVVTVRWREGMDSGCIFMVKPILPIVGLDIGGKREESRRTMRFLATG